ncbi:MAG: YegP family protein [Sulfurovaceae bacterium]
MSAYFLIRRNDSASQPYHFVLVAPNNQVILLSENYSTKQGALNGIASVQENCPYDSQYERKMTSNRQYMFNLRARNGQVIGTSEFYTTEASRENGISSVKRNGTTTDIREE